MNTCTTAIYIIILLFLAPNAPAQTHIVSPTSSADQVKLHTLADKAVRDAKRDIARGRLIIKTFGLPNPWDERLADLLYTYYGVITQRVGGDVLTVYEHTYWNEYNRISFHEIEARYGSDMLDKLTSLAKFDTSGALGNDLHSPPQDGIEAFEIYYPAWDDPPDSLGGQRAFGDVLIRFGVLPSGKIVSPSVEALTLQTSPTSAPAQWTRPFQDSVWSSRDLTKFFPWILTQFRKTTVKVNARHFRWVLDDTIFATHRFEINRSTHPSVFLQEPADQPPMTLLPRNSILQASVTAWINKSSQLMFYRIKSIQMTTFNPSSHAILSDSYFSAQTEPFDTTQNFSGDFSLYKNFRPWIDKFVKSCHFDVVSAQLYFKYYNLAPVFFYLGNNDQRTHSNQ